MFPNATESFIKANIDKDNKEVDKDNMQLDIEKLYESYLRTGSVHKTAIEFSVTGETVRQHLMRSGKKLNDSKWSDDEIQVLKIAYSSTSGFDIPELAKIMGRTYAAIACKADDLGICSKRGKQIRTKTAYDNACIAQKDVSSRPEILLKRARAVSAAFKKNGHPRGMLGKSHSQESRDAISVGNSGRIRPIEETIKSMKTKLERYGSINPGKKRGSWKSAWRIIGGVRKFYRSRWEANYARYLEFQKQSSLIKSWKHECETFWFTGIKRGCVSYLPDFQVINNDGSIEYHEVKGWMDSQSKTKIKRMGKYYPEIKLRVFDSKWYKSNKRKLSAIIKDWE